MLKENRLIVAKKTVDSYMRELGIRVVWVTYMIYIHTLSVFVYLIYIVNLYSRAIVGWHLSDSPSEEDVLNKKSIILIYLVR